MWSMQGALDGPGGRLDSLLTLINAPLSDPNGELWVRVHMVCGAGRRRAAEVIPGLPAA